MKDLDERKQYVLESIIRDYVATAEPVGSRSLARNYLTQISAATIRNEMSDLEQMGYLEQPHTSAGRIPSQQGLRYYVDRMMQSEKVSDEEFETLHDMLESRMQDLEDVVYNVGRYIARITNYVSFVIVPAVRFDQIANIQLYQVQEGLALLVVMTDLGALLYERIIVPPDVTSRELQVVAKIFRQALVGSSLGALRKSDLKTLKDQLVRHQQVMNQVLQAIDNMQENDRDDKVIVNGVLNLLNEPEFRNMERLRYLVALLEGKDSVKQLVPESTKADVDIRIGKENPGIESQELSLVFSEFKAQNHRHGKIGLLGPVRMEYWKATGTIEAVRIIMDELLGSD